MKWRIIETTFADEHKEYTVQRKIGCFWLTERWSCYEASGIETFPTREAALAYIREQEAKALKRRLSNSRISVIVEDIEI